MGQDCTGFEVPMTCQSRWSSLRDGIQTHLALNATCSSWLGLPVSWQGVKTDDLNSEVVLKKMLAPSRSLLLWGKFLTPTLSKD